MNAELDITNALTVAPGKEKTAGEMRGKILALESELLKRPQVEIPTLHHFCDGVYVREIKVPRGTCITGATHKCETINILSQGEMSVWTEGGMKRLKASSIVPSKPGIKRVGYAHEDSVWVTIFHNPVNERDPETLWRAYAEEDFSQSLESKLSNPQLTEQGKLGGSS